MTQRHALIRMVEVCLGPKAMGYPMTSFFVEGAFFRLVTFLKAKDAIALGVMMDPTQVDIRSNLVDMQRR